MPSPDPLQPVQPPPAKPEAELTVGNTHVVWALVAIVLGCGVLWWTSSHKFSEAKDGDGAYIRGRIAQYRSDKRGDTASAQELCQSARQIAKSFDRIGDIPDQREWNEVSQQECTAR